MSSEENSDIEIESRDSDDSSEDNCEEHPLTPEKSTFKTSVGDIRSN